MKHANSTLAARLPGVRSIATAMALVFASASQGAPTDIASTPIITTTAALVKPNIMLLMDASGSMGRTHMPDEVEIATGPTSIGYKSSQCNALYYNPSQTYFLPKDSTGTAFTAPTFTSAPYAGFGSYYLPPDTTPPVDLSSKFVAYDNTTLETPVPPASLDTPQAAYYYVYTGPETLKYSLAPCTQDDTLGILPGTVATPGGGLWTKVVVGAGEQQNFANWYAFYRTRLALIKSAASLAFSPLNDTKRVGFITVQPKDTPASSGINSVRFLPVGDFNSTQKGKWFQKLFQQPAGGASPAREGLARVGRYYGGQQDGINTNMPATGADDPVQYSCQQNFTIMTTDGYWNGQTETPGPLGGGVNLLGTAKVGQQDGTLSDVWSPRPIWDGTSSGNRVDTDKTNAYTDNACSLSAGRFKSTFQTQKRTFVSLRDSFRNPRHTVQYQASSVQSEAQTTQTTKTVTQNPQTTVQYALEHHHFTEEKYKVIKWLEQTTEVQDQYQLRTIQKSAQTKQTEKIVKQTIRTAEQWTTATSQYVVTKTQYKFGKEQFRLQVQQVFIERWRIIKHVGGDEVGVASDDDCVNVPGLVVCERRVLLSSRLIDPDSCSAGTSSDGFFVHTTCTPGPLNQADQAVMSCSPSVVHSGLPDFTKTTCVRAVVLPAYGAIDGTCTAGVTQGAGPDFFIYTCDLPAANNSSTPVPFCTVSSSSSGDPDYITTACVQPTATNQPATNSAACSPGSTTDGLQITTTCVKKPNVTGPSDSCLDDDGTAPPFLKVTCVPGAPSFDQYVPSTSCSAGSTGIPDYIVTTCTTLPAGPYVSPTFVATCVDGASSNSPDYFETSCTTDDHTDYVTAAQCAVASDTASPWITRICTKPFDNTTSFNDPALCIPDLGTSYPYLKVTCTPGDTVPPFPPTPVDPRLECGTFGTTVGPAAGGFVVTHCDKLPVSMPNPSATCMAGIDPITLVVTTCGDVTFDVPVSFCNVGDTSTDGIDTVVCVKPPGANNTTVNISSTCVDTPASGPGWVAITCPTPIVTVTIVDPLSCAAGTTIGPGPAVLVTNCSAANPVAPYVGWTAVPSCSNNWDGTVRTTCRQPALTNFTTRDSAPCSTNTDGNYVTTTCSQVITDDFPVTCSAVPQSGTGPDVTCPAQIVNNGEAVASCAVGVSGSATDATTTTACNTGSDTGFVDFAGICSAPPVTGPGFVQTQCREVPGLVHVADSGCVESPNSGSGIRTTCVDDVGGTGHKYSVVVTKTVTTTPYSGSVPSGASVVVPTVGVSTSVDGVCYATAQTLPVKPPVDIGGCTVWPCTTMTSGDTGSENSLADVAQYYYKTDLRPTMVDNVPSAGTGVEDDNAPHQHMTTFTIGLGVSGTLVYNADYRSLATTTGDFADIRTGAKGWPLWPDPALVYSDFTNYNNPKSIDDFWHTAVNGRGRFFSANDPTTVVQGLGDALAKIDDVVASGTADSVSTLQPTSTNNFVYSTSYKSGVWQGDIESRTLDISSGLPGATVWSAKDLLGPRELATCDARDIYVLHGGATATLTNFAFGTHLCPTRVPPGTLTNTMDAVDQPYFGLASLSQLSQWALMSPAQQAAALADPGALVNFLRGQRASEGYVYNSTTKFFRQRGEGVANEGILGDIVDSQPVYVGEPFASYQENDYATFKSTRSGREPMLYVGANDGMLHAFYASLTATYGGQEAWAVIPSAVVPNLYKLADVNYKRDGHQFYVDGTPVVGDVWDGSNWKTILVGGLGAGGKGYYALDVTAPGVLPTPKWEFKLDLASCPTGSTTAFPANTYYGDCNLGLTFGKPVITKLPGGQWVVMFTSGYNNVNGAATNDGVGFLYVVDALKGFLVNKIPTTGGSPGTPNGLAQINNYVDNVLLDNTTLRVYGGDVLGQMWRFDILPTATATLLGTAKDLATAATEPITIRPELAELDGKPFVMFGTGKLLGSSDVTDPQKQSVYGFRDPLVGGSPIYPDPLRASLRPMKVTQTGTGAAAVRDVVCTGSAGDCARPAGFVLDLAEAGERVNVEMKLVLGALVFSSNVPEEIPCSVGGHSWFNQIDFRTGAPIPGAITSQYLSDSINVGFNVLQLPPPAGSTNPQYVGLFRQSKATNLERQVTPPEPFPQGKRISWREIAQ